MNARARAQRQAVRMRAADLFDRQVPVSQIVVELRVTEKSVYLWRQAWVEGGRAALASKGPSGSACRLDASQLGRLEAELDRGPAAHGWVEDQRWTLSRVTVLIGKLFHVSYTERGVSYLLHRIGWSPQVPVHRATERDEAKIACWREETWSRVRPWPATSGRGCAGRTKRAGH